MGSEHSLENLRTRLARFRDQREWRRFHNPKNLAASLSIESAEVLELYQWMSDEEATKAIKDREFRENMSSELADVFIYLLYLADTLDIDLVEAANTKVARNAERFPVSEKPITNE